jgi:hypothetical protein
VSASTDRREGASFEKQIKVKRARPSDSSLPGTPGDPWGPGGPVVPSESSLRPAPCGPGACPGAVRRLRADLSLAHVGTRRGDKAAPCPGRHVKTRPGAMRERRAGASGSMSPWKPVGGGDTLPACRRFGGIHATPVAPFVQVRSSKLVQIRPRRAAVPATGTHSVLLSKRRAPRDCSGYVTGPRAGPRSPGAAGVGHSRRGSSAGKTLAPSGEGLSWGPRLPRMT